jgi:hypothetical protein
VSYSSRGSATPLRIGRIDAAPLDARGQGRALRPAGNERRRGTAPAGTGDAFASGFLTLYAEGASIRECMEFAAANAVNVLRLLGAKTGILRAPADATAPPRPGPAAQSAATAKRSLSPR